MSESTKKSCACANCNNASCGCGGAPKKPASGAGCCCGETCTCGPDCQCDPSCGCPAAQARAK